MYASVAAGNICCIDALLKQELESFYALLCCQKHMCLPVSHTVCKCRHYNLACTQGLLLYNVHAQTDLKNACNWRHHAAGDGHTADTQKQLLAQRVYTICSSR